MKPANERTERPRGTGAVALVLCAAVLVAAGQGAGRAGPQDRPAVVRVPASTSPARLCRLAEVDIDATWDPTKTGAPGYGRVPNFLEAASPYLTSWSLRLSRAMGVGLGPVSVSAIHALFLRDLAHPRTEARQASEAPLYLTLLAVQGLHALHAPIPTADVRRDLAPLLVDGAYRASTKAPPSIGATTDAADIAAVAHITLPASVLSHIRAEWPAALRATTAHAIYKSGLPVVASAVLLHAFPDKKMAAALHSVLPAWRRELISAGTPGVGIGLLALLFRVGHRIGIRLPPPPASYITPIEHKSGFLTLFPGTRFGADPQVTLNALETGLHLPSTAAQTLEVGRLRQGWVFVNEPASISSTERAVALQSSCGERLPHRSALRALVARWVASASTAQIDTKSSDKITPINGSIRTGLAIQLEQLAKLVGRLSVHLTATSRAAFLAAIRRLLFPAALGSAPLLRVAAGVEALQLLGQRLPSAEETILVERLASAHPTTSIEIGAAELLARAMSGIHDEALVERLRVAEVRFQKAMDALQRPEGVAAAPSLSRPDIFSTETAAYVLRSGQPESQSVLAPFLTPIGPGASLDTSPGDEVTSSSLLAGVELAQGSLSPFLSR